MSGSQQYDYISNTGVIVADTATTQEVIQSEFIGALGSALNLADFTPQGVLVSAETTARNAVIQNNALLANQINPNYSGGIFLDAVASLSGLERDADTPTIVQGVTLAGVHRSPVAAGSIANDANGNQFTLVTAVTLGATSGRAIGEYQSVLTGPIPCATGGMTIVSDVLGLETIFNPGTAVSLGMAEQDDETFRVLRRNTLALQSVSLREATQSALWNLGGVIGVQTIENNTGADFTSGGVTVAARTFWSCIDGGSTSDIGMALLENKSYGCGWTGGQTIDVTEPASGQVYVVLYDLPTDIPLVARVTVRQGTYQGNPIIDVPPAVETFATNQLPTVAGFTVGENASPFEVANGINVQLPGLYIVKVELSLKSSVAYSTNEIAMLMFQKATILESDVLVVFG